MPTEAALAELRQSERAATPRTMSAASLREIVAMLPEARDEVLLVLAFVVVILNLKPPS